MTDGEEKGEAMYILPGAEELLKTEELTPDALEGLVYSAVDKNQDALIGLTKRLMPPGGLELFALALGHGETIYIFTRADVVLMPPFIREKVEHLVKKLDANPPSSFN